MGKIVPVESITFIKFDSVNLKKTDKNFAKQLSAYKNTQVLILTKCELESKKISSFDFPNLRYVDLSNNSITDLTPVLDCLTKASNLEILILDNNPVCSKPSIKERVSVFLRNNKIYILHLIRLLLLVQIFEKLEILKLVWKRD